MATHPEQIQGAARFAALPLGRPDASVVARGGLVPAELRVATSTLRPQAPVIDPARDALLTGFGRATLADRYLLPGESYQDLFARVADAYAEVKWRHSLDAATPGLSNALTFRARAASVGSTLEILGDPVLREVVTVALGIPKQIAFQSIEAQQKAIDTRLDVAKLKDKGFVEKFAQRYLLEAAKTAAPDDGSDLTALSVRAGGLTA